jgi:ATP-binding cassette, subfamily B, bacterial
VLPKERKLLSKSDRALLKKYLGPQWPRAVLLGGLLLIGIVLQLANPQIVKIFIDQAEAGVAFDTLIQIALAFLGVALLTQVALVAETYVAHDLGWRTTNALRADLTRHVLSLDGAFHAEHTAGELIERIDGDVAAIAGFFSRFVVQVLGNTLFLIGILVLLLREDWRIGLMLTAFAAGALVYMTKGGGFVGVRARDARRAAADLTGYLEETLGGLPDLKANGADAYVMRGLHLRSAARYRRVASSAMAGSLFNGTIGLFFVVGAGAALSLSAWLHLTGVVTLGTIYLVFRYTGMLRLPLDRLARQMGSFQRATGGIVRVRELLSRTSRIANGAHTLIPNGALDLELEGVWFTYDHEPVLRDVSFRLRPGEVLGLLGRTGSGKTTISRLLFRLYDPERGCVRLDGTDIKDTELEALRSHIGLVTQDVQLFEGTVRDNVAFFDTQIPDSKLHEVFTTLGLKEWLRTLPDGLDTTIGPRGRGLSAGESQLVAMARVFLKDPGLIVLDEASSRLDPHTQELLESAIERLLTNRTAIVIAHRLETVNRADSILVLDGGRVAELGPREQLARDPDSRFSKLLRTGMAEELA